MSCCWHGDISNHQRENEQLRGRINPAPSSFCFQHHHLPATTVSSLLLTSESCAASSLPRLRHHAPLLLHSVQPGC
uniref:Uncharacterized protein n=1 Tax=Oryza nivara TaxID=4536 RepID=A0A0E0HZU3_ORYNI